MLATGSNSGIGTETELGAAAETETEADNSFTSRGGDFSKTSPLCDSVTTQSGKDLCESLLN